MGTDPIVQTLRPGGFGIGVVYHNVFLLTPIGKKQHETCNLILSGLVNFDNFLFFSFPVIELW